MFKHILVPLDGSELAAAVLPHVATLAQETKARVTLLSVLERRNGSSDANPVDWHLRRMETQLYLDEIKGQLTPLLDGELETQVLEGFAADRISEYAQKNECDLIALSTHGATGLHSWNMGSVAQKVIQGAGKSVLLVRAYQPDRRSFEAMLQPIHYQRILLPLDGSLRAEAILPTASALAQHQTAQLLLMHVVTRPEMVQRAPVGAEDAALLEQVMERNLAYATNYIEEVNARLPFDLHTRVVVSDNVARALTETARNEGVDLILLAAHGSANQPIWPYGSAAANLIANGETPLLILQDLPLAEIAPSPTERAATALRGVDAQRMSTPPDRIRTGVGK